MRLLAFWCNLQRLPAVCHTAHSTKPQKLPRFSGVRGFFWSGSAGEAGDVHRLAAVHARVNLSHAGVLLPPDGLGVIEAELIAHLFEA